MACAAFIDHKNALPDENKAREEKLFRIAYDVFSPIVDGLCTDERMSLRPMDIETGIER